MKNVILAVKFTVNNKEQATDITKKLLAEKLIACANICPISSVYFWNGKLEEAEEMEIICKTTIKLHNRVVARIMELHPYDLPGIAAYPVEANEAYALWVLESVRD